jgi:diguanylate cyclase (GGDEF)-like protein/PAS domain S-box-containing protein
MRMNPNLGMFAGLAAAPALPPELFTVLLDAMPVPIALVSLDTGKTILLNQAFRQTYDRDGKSGEIWSDVSDRIIDPEQRELARRPVQSALALHPETGAPLQIEEMELVLRDSEDRERMVLHSGLLLPAMGCAIGFYVDLSAQKAVELRLAHAEQSAREREILYPVLLELTQEMIVLTGVDGRRNFVSPAVLPLTGWTQEEFLAKRTEDTVHPADLAKVLAARTRCVAGSRRERIQYRTLRKNGTWLWIEATAACYRDPKTQTPLGYVATMRDSTEEQAEDARRTQREALLEQQARFDHLTRVANRHVFYTALSDEARRQTRRTQSLSLLLVDIDHFKLFNDRYGHLEGDRVLRQVADILKLTASRVADLVARFGGEEFVLLLPMTDAAGARTIAEKILTAVRTEAIPHLDSPSGALTVSVGVACWRGSSLIDRDELLLNADKALYSAKKQGRDRYAMDPAASISAVPADAGPVHRRA